MIGIVKDGTPF